MKLRHRLCSPDRLTETIREKMFQLMSEHYENLNQVGFAEDLNEKTGVILLEDESSIIRGFSTYLIYKNEKLNCRVIYSGDTIIHQDYWGSPELFYGFGRLLKQLMAEKKPDEKIYWFLLSKGYRTYYMLPLFFESYLPQAGKQDRDELKQHLDILAGEKFPEHYNPVTGLVEVEGDHLKEDLAGIPRHKEKDPHIRLFLMRNPHYRRGNELACLTEITEENIRPPARRFVR